MACGGFPLATPWDIPGWVICTIIDQITKFFTGLIDAVRDGIVAAFGLVAQGVVAIIQGIEGAVRVVGTMLVTFFDAAFRGLGLGAPMVIVFYVLFSAAALYVGIVIAKFLLERLIERF